MIEYECFNCGKMVPSNIIIKKIRCHHCGSRVLKKIKDETSSRVIKAR